MILEFDVTYGDVDPENFREAFNDVIIAAIPVLNEQLRGGIPDPIIEKPFGVSDVEISIQKQYLKLGMNFKQASEMVLNLLE
mmetsp:Transcript_28380/g.25226  ORF Transcript_28380/g.25226 Transcript_28380/m.25226 type:complete len:82 (+) Transcript_28380:1076-1321(+)